MSGAIVKLEGEFVLATDYGANPMVLGVDLDNHSKDPRGIIRSARLWEISYLMKEYVDQTTSLVPEARFRDKGRKERFVTYVLDNPEQYNGEPAVEYDVRGGTVYVRPTTFDIEELPLDQVFRNLGLTRTEFIIGAYKGVEIAKKYRDLINHIASIPKYQVASDILKRFLGFVDEFDKRNMFFIAVRDATSRVVSELYSNGKRPDHTYVKQRIIDEHRELLPSLDLEYREILRKIIETEESQEIFNHDQDDHIRNALQRDVSNARTVQKLLVDGLDEDFLTAFTEIGEVESFSQLEIIRRTLLV